MAAEERHTETEVRIRAAMARLLGGDIPEGLKCDVKSLCALSGVPRATLYRSYTAATPTSKWNSNVNAPTLTPPGTTRTHD